MRYLIAVCVLLIVGSCQRNGWDGVFQQRVDSAVRAQGITAKKITFAGPVTFTSQTGTGHTATSAATDNTKAGKKAAAAAIGAGSSASATSTGTPWGVYLLLVGVSLVLGIVAGCWLRGKLRF